MTVQAGGVRGCFIYIPKNTLGRSQGLLHQKPSYIDKHCHECFWITCNINIISDTKTWKKNNGYYQLWFLLMSLHPSWMLHDIPSQHKQTHAKEIPIPVIKQTTHIKTFITYYALELSPCTFKCANSNRNYEF
jgi:hypothetical protein